MQTVIHEMSSAVPLAKFDLFGVPPTQSMVERDILTEHKPITAVDPNSFIQFEIPTALDEYIDLDKIYFYLKVKLKTMAEIKNIEDWDDISPVNYLLHSMIKQMDIFIGDKQVSSSSPTYAYKAYIEATLGFSKETKASHLTSALWFDDEDRKIDGPISVKNHDIMEYKVCDLYGRLHSDLAFQGRSLLGGCKLTIRILLNDPKFYLLSAHSQPEFEFLDCSLHVHRAKVPQMIVEAHDAALRVSTAKYPITLSKVKPFTLPKGVIDTSIDNLHSGQLPRRIFIFFVLNKSYCGDYMFNPYNFHNFQLTSLCVYVDGVQYPPQPFTPDFHNNLVQKEMIALYESLDLIDGVPPFKINRANFGAGNLIFAFNFAPDLTSGCGASGHLNPIKFGSLRLNVRFKVALPDPVTALMYCEFDKMLEIDINRTASIDMF